MTKPITLSLLALAVAFCAGATFLFALDLMPADVVRPAEQLSFAAQALAAPSLLAGALTFVAARRMRRSTPVRAPG